MVGDLGSWYPAAEFPELTAGVDIPQRRLGNDGEPVPKEYVELDGKR